MGPLGYCHKIEPSEPDYRCPCCGHVGPPASTPVLWGELVAQWELSPLEAESIDRREGQRCTNCLAPLRSGSLALAITRHHDWTGTLASWVATKPTLRVLEINRAGELTPWLAQLPGHRLVEYPEIDMERMPFESGTWDLIVHSDTIEHVDQPVAALRECRRLLRAGGRMCCTTPIVPGRLSRRRDGLVASYHGSETDQIYRVVTEYGADFWVQLFDAGFTQMALDSLQWPDAVAITAAAP
jgi:SAM-dependent methyltransferase